MRSIVMTVTMRRQTKSLNMRVIPRNSQQETFTQSAVIAKQKIRTPTTRI